MSFDTPLIAVGQAPIPTSLEPTAPVVQFGRTLFGDLFQAELAEFSGPPSDVDNLPKSVEAETSEGLREVVQDALQTQAVSDITVQRPVNELPAPKARMNPTRGLSETSITTRDLGAELVTDGEKNEPRERKIETTRPWLNDGNAVTPAVNSNLAAMKQAPSLAESQHDPDVTKPRLKTELRAELKPTETMYPRMDTNSWKAEAEGQRPEPISAAAEFDDAETHAPDLQSKKELSKKSAGAEDLSGAQVESEVKKKGLAAVESGEKYGSHETPRVPVDQVSVLEAGVLLKDHSNGVSGHLRSMPVTTEGFAVPTVNSSMADDISIAPARDTEAHRLKSEFPLLRTLNVESRLQTINAFLGDTGEKREQVLIAPEADQKKLVLFGSDLAKKPVVPDSLTNSQVPKLVSQNVATHIPLSSTDQPIVSLASLSDPTSSPESWVAESRRDQVAVRGEHRSFWPDGAIRPHSFGSVSLQIARAMGDAQSPAFVIRLDPEELGSVRLVLTPREGGLQIAVFAERAEALDLLRREASNLSTTLDDLGVEHQEFTFAEDQLRHHPLGHPDMDRPATSDISIDPGTTSAPVLHMTTSGLDLRL